MVPPFISRTLRAAQGRVERRGLPAGAARQYLEHRVRGNLFAIFAIVVVISIGTAGYMLIEDWSFNDSFFMTITTLSTVGYTIVHPLSPAGEYFTSALIVAGVGVAFTASHILRKALSKESFERFEVCALCRKRSIS